MEDYVLENSKGATYMSFILDVEIVLKKEGKVNVAEERVRNKKETHGDSKDREQQNNDPNMRNNDTKVYSLLTEQKNLKRNNDKNVREISNKINYRHLIMNENEATPLKSPQKYNKAHVQKESKPSHKKKYHYHKNFENQKFKSFHSQETNQSDDFEERQYKRRRISKPADIFKGKTEPADFMECNRIFMCNYFLMQQKNDESVQSHNFNKILKSNLEHIKHLIEKNISINSVKAVSEIVLISNKKRTYPTNSSLTNLMCMNNPSFNNKILINTNKCRGILEKTDQTLIALKKYDLNENNFNYSKLNCGDKPNTEYLNKNKLNVISGMSFCYARTPALRLRRKTKSLCNMEIGFINEDSTRYTKSSYELGSTVSKKSIKYNEILNTFEKELHKVIDDVTSYYDAKGPSKISQSINCDTEMIEYKKKFIKFRSNFFIRKIKSFNQKCTVFIARSLSTIQNKLLIRKKVNDFQK